MEENSDRKFKLRDYIPFYGIYNYQLRTENLELNPRVGLLIFYSGMFGGLILKGLEKVIS